MSLHVITHPNAFISNSVNFDIKFDQDTNLVKNI